MLLLQPGFCEPVSGKPALKRSGSVTEKSRGENLLGIPIDIDGRIENTAIYDMEIRLVRFIDITFETTWNYLRKTNNQISVIVPRRCRAMAFTATLTVWNWTKIERTAIMRNME
jgi:hypothetical protein